MASSPALKIVRHSKTPGVAVGGARVAGVQPTRTPPVAERVTFTMTDADVGRELIVSAKTVRRMHRDGKLPKPVMVGSRSVRWVRSTIVDWLAAGCPDRATFEASRKGGS